MKLRSLSVNQFKKFTSPMRLDDIEDGLNIVVGPNEMGKSTLLDALRAVLFEKYSSKAKSITALQNDRNQAAPVVQLEFELDDGIYRMTKRFVKNPFARLSCPDGRNLLGDEAEETLRELLGFVEPGNRGAGPETLGMWNVLWVQQGQSFGVPRLPDSAQSSLHNALESEVGTVLGGKRGRALPQEIERQLNELVTKGKRQPRGTYKELIDRVEELRESHNSLQEHRRELTETLDELEVAQKSLERLSSSDYNESDQKDIDEARRRHSQISELETRIEGAVSEQKLRKHNLEQAEQNATNRQQLKNDIRNQQIAFETADNRLKEVFEQEEEARSHLDKLRTNISDAEEAVEQADKNVSRQRRIFNAVERDIHIRRLEDRFEKARDAEKHQRKVHQDITAILVTDGIIKAIRKANKKLETIRNQLNAIATHITFDMPPKALSSIKVNGKSLATKQPSIDAVELVTITIPNHGKITVEPKIADRVKLLRQQDKAETDLQNALEEGGVKTFRDAEDQYGRRMKLLQDAELAKQKVELFASATDEYDAGATALSSHIEGLREVLKREMKELSLRKIPDIQKSEATLHEKEEQDRKARETLNVARASLSGPEDRLGQLRTELGTVRARRDDSKERLKKLHQQLAETQEARTDDELQTDIETARTSLLEQETIITDLESQRTDETPPQLEARIQRLQRAIQDRNNKRAKLNEKIAGLKSRVEIAEGAGIDEAIGQKTRELELAEEELHRQKREVRLLSLLLSTLRDAEQEAKERYLSPILKRVQPYLQLLFPNAEIQIDENLHITGVVREAGYEEKFDHLSMGTQEQIAVLVRLAFAEMLVEQGHPATVVLDDALVFSDDQRMERMFDIFNMAANNVQVVILTCREQLFEGLGGRSLSLTRTNTEELASA